MVLIDRVHHRVIGVTGTLTHLVMGLMSLNLQLARLPTSMVKTSSASALLSCQRSRALTVKGWQSPWGRVGVQL